jgi:hypothetical protein
MLIRINLVIVCFEFESNRYLKTQEASKGSFVAQ